MTLREKQSAFARLVSRLIIEATRRGYEITLGEAWRSPQEAQRQGFPNSLHTKRLAIDINLFRDGVYLTTAADHKPLGLWWEAQSTPELKCAWGGRFGESAPGKGDGRDANHYSIRHGGVR
jgi:hypothetical protein